MLVNQRKIESLFKSSKARFSSRKTRVGPEKKGDDVR
ncbi:hypothetical protein SLEP1_g21735 [Rubroshorea leprosula]|uniref:Uncharacterized protein n=1 Tax=Rubroshorea leprosula TaxID=152421 RepID=A0AAV5J6Y4_9ROSI|nr:hypothetical protein SLEP1_g21735 [Rubroshorea leprosula]